MKIYVIVAQGNAAPPHSGSLMDQAGLDIEAAFTDPDEAYRYSTMGDMEIHEVDLEGVQPIPAE